MGDARKTLDDIRSRIDAYDGGDRASSPPVSLLRQEQDLMRATEDVRRVLTLLRRHGFHVCDGPHRTENGSSGFNDIFHPVADRDVLAALGSQVSP